MPLRLRFDKSVFLVVLLMMTVIAALRVSSLNVPFLNRDEAGTAFIANAVVAHGVPYRDGMDNRGPLTSYLYAAAFALFGKGNMAAVHALLLLMVMLTAAGVAAVGEALAGKEAGLLAGLVFAWISSCSASAGDLLAFHTEWPAALCVVYALWCALKAGAGGHTARWALMAGALLALAASARQQALLDTLVIGAALAVTARRHALAWMAVGFAAVSALWLAYFWASGALKDFWQYYWVYNSAYYIGIVPLAERVARAVPYLTLQQGFLAENSILAAGGMVFGVYALLNRSVWRIFLLFWIAGGIAGALYSGRGYGHYFIMLLAPLALMAGILMDAAHRHSRRFGIVLSVVFLAAIAYQTRHYFPVERPKGIGYGKPLGELVRFINGTTAANDRIFVWGWNAEIYTLTGRGPATRFPDITYFTGFIPYENKTARDTSAWAMPGSWDEFMYELRSRRPALFIDTTPSDPVLRKYYLGKYADLAEFLQVHYRPDCQFKDASGNVVYQVYRALIMP